MLRVASCQFSIEGDIAHNRAEILRQMSEAAERGARIVHFPEATLSGYPDYDRVSFADLDWKALRAAMDDIRAAAARLKVWTLVGSAHRLSDGRPPHNSIYVISPEGEVIDRYDKRFCTGDCHPKLSGDLAHYTPGDHATVFEVDGYRCGVLICYDYRFTELFRDLKRRGVEVLFHSYHNAHYDRETFEHGNIWKEIVPAIMVATAATNHFWVSATNSTAQYSLWPSFFVRPDGLITGRLGLHEPGVLISTVDRDAPIRDWAASWRDRALAGQLHSGTLVDDPRSVDRTCY